MIQRLLIIGIGVEHHIGAHFLTAARQLGLTSELLDVQRAWSANRWLNRIFFHLGGHRPSRLGRFELEVQSACQSLRPQLLAVIGISPPSAGLLSSLGELGIRRCNFLTDDPWNPKNHARYFLKSLPHYETIYNPRRSNMPDLMRHGCQRVEYLPFGFQPELHFAESPRTPAERERFVCDVALIGGADEERFPIAQALVRTGLKINLYGAYWGKYSELRTHWKGSVFGRELRMAVSGASVNLGLVRRANRDGHAMRSFEVPAMGGCMLTEDTAEHREIFGEDGKTVVYFDSIPQMAERARSLLAHPDERRRLAAAAHELITQGKNTYADRLQTMLGAEGRRGDETTRRPTSDLRSPTSSVHRP